MNKWCVYVISASMFASLLGAAAFGIYVAVTVDLWALILFPPLVGISVFIVFFTKEGLDLAKEEEKKTHRSGHP